MKWVALLLPLVLLPLLAGCAPALLGGGVGASVIANEERTAGSFIEDQTIEFKIANRMLDLGGQVNVDAVSYNRRVLLLGQVPTEEMQQHVVSLVEQIENVRQIYNYLEIGGNASLAANTADAVLTGKIKAVLCSLQVPGFSCLDIKVVSNSGVVYLFGLVSEEQAATAVQETRSQSGVKRVVKLFEYQK